MLGNHVEFSQFDERSHFFWFNHAICRTQ
jgi:hypothetical protein